MKVADNPKRAAEFFAWKRALWSDNALRATATLSTGSRDVRATAACVADTFGSWGHNCWPATETVAVMIGCSEKTIRRHLQLLVAEGWFTVRKRPGKTTIYDIATPTGKASTKKPPRRLSSETIRLRKRCAAQRRRARQAGMPGENIAPAFERFLYVAQLGRCGLCGFLMDPSEMHLDHIIPLSRRGWHTPRNLQLTHPACNMVKGDRLDPRRRPSLTALCAG